MISAFHFWQILRKNGFNFFSGIPCSILKEVLNNPPKSAPYIPATREDNALGLVSGAYLAGKRGAILIQNSGLGNIFNALTSFNLIYKIPVLMIITWRGEPGKPDAPEHEVMGRVTLPTLETLNIPHKIINENFAREVKWAVKTMEEKEIPVALILKKGVVG